LSSNQEANLQKQSGQWGENLTQTYNAPTKQQTVAAASCYEASHQQTIPAEEPNGTEAINYGQEERSSPKHIPNSAP